MWPDGICRVTNTRYTKTIQYQDINYQLSQNEDKTAIFEAWCDFLNYFDSSVQFQLSFVNLSASQETFARSISIPPCGDEFDGIRAEYAGIQLKFRVTPQEREMIETKMAQFGTTNMAAYLRKMAIDGYVVKLDLPELRELVSLLRYSSNNLNQLTRRAHETGRIYEADLEDIQQSQERIWTAAEKIVSSLAALK